MSPFWRFTRYHYVFTGVSDGVTFYFHNAKSRKISPENWIFLGIIGYKLRLLKTVEVYALRFKNNDYDKFDSEVD